MSISRAARAAPRIQGAHQDGPTHSMIQESQLSNFWRERCRTEGEGHYNWRAQAYALETVKPRVANNLRKSLSEEACSEFDSTMARRDRRALERRHNLKSNNRPIDTIPTRSHSVDDILLEQPLRHGAAGHQVRVHMGASPLYPTRFTRGQATHSWKHFINNHTGRGDKMQVLESETKDNFKNRMSASTLMLPRGKAVLKKLCDGATPQKRVYCDLPPIQR